MQNCQPFSLGDEFADSDRITINAGYAFTKYNWLATPFLEIAFGLGIANNDYLKDQTWHPRLEGRYELNSNWTLTGAIGQHHQFPSPREFQFISKKS